MQKKLKVLVLSDHALSTSGVGTQTRHLITGLLEKNHWTFRQFGAALKHSDYRTVVINDDFIIKPIDGFGNKEMLNFGETVLIPASAKEVYIKADSCELLEVTV